MLNITRTFRHLFTTHWKFKRAFPEKALAAIEQEIRKSEAAHTGEIRFVVEVALSGAPLHADLSARQRAIDVFSQLRMWDTALRNGVLIYLLLADRSVEIVADRGVHVKTNVPDWETICRNMEAAFQSSNYEQGVIEGIKAVNHLLAKHFPAAGANRNELPDTVVVM